MLELGATSCLVVLSPQNLTLNSRNRDLDEKIALEGYCIFV